jgi:hypothetical protein
MKKLSEECVWKYLLILPEGYKSQIRQAAAEENMSMAKWLQSVVEVALENKNK